MEAHWLVWPLGAFLLYVFGVPLIILGAFKHEANPTLQPIDPVEFPLPDLVRQHFDSVGAQLEQLGFVEAGTLLLPSQMPNVRALIRIYVKRPAQESAMVSSVFGLANGQVSSHMRYVEFCTRYVNGQEINTGNASTGGGAFPPRADALSIHTPWIHDIIQLYLVHHVVTAAKAPTARKELRLDTVFRGDLAASVAAGMQEELEHAVRAGYLRLTPARTEYRATVKGAYLMTWKQMWPFKAIVVAHRRRAAKELLASVGVS